MLRGFFTAAVARKPHVPFTLSPFDSCISLQSPGCTLWSWCQSPKPAWRREYSPSSSMACCRLACCFGWSERLL